MAELPKGVKAALYADDLVLWCKEEHASTATYRLQQAANMLLGWAEDWCLSVNKKVLNNTLHPVSKAKSWHHQLGNTRLKENKANYLGVTLTRQKDNMDIPHHKG